MARIPRLAKLKRQGEVVTTNLDAIPLLPYTGRRELVNDAHRDPVLQQGKSKTEASGTGADLG